MNRKKVELNLVVYPEVALRVLMNLYEDGDITQDQFIAGCGIAIKNIKLFRKTAFNEEEV